MVTRTYLKNVFWPPAFFGGIGASFQILDILQYACGLKLGPAAILNQNPIFEMGSNINQLFIEVIPEMVRSLIFQRYQNCANKKTKG
jgi:hypothetical protein